MDRIDDLMILFNGAMEEAGSIYNKNNNNKYEKLQVN